MDAPLWFVILGAIAFVIYILYRMFIGNPLFASIGFLKGKLSGCGCIVSIILGIFLGGLMIWYVLSDLF